MSRKGKQQKRNQRKAKASSEPSKEITVAATGQKVNRRRRVNEAGPMEVNISSSAMKAAVKKVGTQGRKSTAKAPFETQGHQVVQGYLNGTDIASFTATESFQNIIAFCQGVAFVSYKLNPSMFANPTSATSSPSAEIITPTDFVAYCAMAILRGYSKAGQLNTTFASAIDDFSDDAKIPVPIAEYIRHRISVRGAPAIARRLTYTTDWTISSGQIVYSGAPGTEIGFNQWGTETNLSHAELWQYQVAAGSQQDLTTYSVPLALNLLTAVPGRDSWVSQRMNPVMSFFASTGSYKLNLVKFGSVPLSTIDYSGFAGPENGRTWPETNRALSPGARHNSDLAMYFNPSSFGAYYPGMSYFSVVSPPSASVQGGSYGNVYGGGGQYFGEPVVPSQLTRVVQVMQTLNHILLSEAGMKKEVFGRDGYKYCGLLVSNLNRINYVPIDIAGLAGKMLRAVTVACNSYGELGLALEAGLPNAIIALAQGCLVRKILTAGQFEFLISLNTQPASGGALTNLWNVQALIPSMDYITSELPLAWTNILDAIGPMYYDGALHIPVFGQTMAQSWATNVGAAKYSNFPKFGFITSVGATYPPNLVPFAGTNLDPTLYQFPYVWLSNPVASPYNIGSYWYGSNVNVNTWNTEATYPTSIGSPEYLPGGSSLLPVYRTTNLYTYDAAVQATYVTDNTTASGRETHMAFQYAEVASMLANIAQIFKDNTKVCKGFSIRPVQQSLGNVGMSSVILATIDNGVNRNYDQLSVFIGDNLLNPGNPFITQLSITMGPSDNEVLHSNVFLTNSRIWLATTLGLNTQYVVPATRPQQLEAYTKSGYATRIVGKTGFSLWGEYCQEVAQDGSATNEELKKLLSKPQLMQSHEEYLTTTRLSSNRKSGAAQGALLDNAVQSGLTYGSNIVDTKQIEKEFEVSKLRGYPTQLVAAYWALHKIDTLRSSDDFSANKLFDGIKKGLKTVLPYVKPVAEGVATLGMMFL